MATVGELVVNLRASTASFARDMSKASQISFQTSKEIERSFKIIGRIALGAATTAGAAMVAMAVRSIDAADRIHELSQQSGISTESLSAFGFAARLSGVDVGTLAKGLRNVNVSIAEASRGTGEAAGAFHVLGIAVRTQAGGLRSTEDVLLDVAGRFSQMSDGAAKTTLAVRLFGKAGEELIPFLNKGREGLEALKVKAHDLGIAIGPEFAKRADELKDSIETSKAKLEGFANKVAEYVLPRFADFLDLLTEGRIHFLADLSALATPTERALAKMTEMFEIGRKKIKTAEAEAALANEEAAERNRKAIAQILAALKDKLEALRLGEGGLELYRLKLAGATAQQLAFARSLQETVRWIEFEESLPRLPLVNMMQEVDVELRKIPLNTRTAIAGLQNLASGISFKPIQKSLTEVQKGLADVGQQAAFSFADAIVAGKGFRDVVAALFSDLARLIARLLVMRALLSIFPGFGKALGLGPASSLVGFGHGGAFSGREPIMVGERGPEIVFPGGPGQVVPARALSGITVVNNYAIDARGADAGVEQRILRLLPLLEERAVRRSLVAVREFSLRTV